MGSCCKFYQSSIGKKVIVSVTGVLLYGFVVGHMLGNLKTFGGFDSEGIHKLDHYAHFLRVMGQDFAGHGGVLWATRIGLIVAALLHVVTVLQLQAINKAARPVKYVKYAADSASLASRTMVISGIVLLFFIVFHIAHLTLGVVPIDGFEHGHVYANVFSTFQSWSMVFVYVVAMALLALHLYHGVWSLFQTLGLDNPDRNKALKGLATLSAIGLFLGFIAVPLSVVLDQVPEPSDSFIEDEAH